MVKANDWGTFNSNSYIRTYFVVFQGVIHLFLLASGAALAAADGRHGHRNRSGRRGGRSGSRLRSGRQFSGGGGFGGFNNRFNQFSTRSNGIFGGISSLPRRGRTEHDDASNEVALSPGTYYV